MSRLSSFTSSAGKAWLRVLRRTSQIRDLTPALWVRATLVAGVAVGSLTLAGAALAYGSEGPDLGDAEQQQARYDGVRDNTTAALAEFSKNRAEAEGAIALGVQTGESLIAALNSTGGYLEEQARTDAVAAADAYLKEVRSVELPETLATLPAEVDVVSAEKFADALAQLERAEGDAVSANELISGAEAKLASLEEELSTALTGFRESLPQRAEVLSGENPDAAEEFRIAVKDAAAEITAAEDVATLPDLMEKFRDAVDALRGDQQRVADAIEAERIEAQRLEAERLEAQERQREQQAVPSLPGLPEPPVEPEATPEPEVTPEPEATPNPAPSPDVMEPSPDPERSTPAEPDSAPAP
jgi:hypothetical protein